MKAQIIRIGNSKGIRIPKAIVKQCEFLDEVELEVKDKKLIVVSVCQKRGNWDRVFTAMEKNHDDALLIAEDTTVSAWDADEWEW